MIPSYRRQRLFRHRARLRISSLSRCFDAGRILRVLEMSTTLAALQIGNAPAGPMAQADPSRSLSFAFGTALPVQGFGYRPVDDLSTSADGRCPKAFREGTRGARGWRSAIYGDLPGQRLG